MTRAERIASRCVHFTGVQNNDCEAGVVYATVKGKSIPYDAFQRLPYPCFAGNEHIACPHRRFPTPDEVAAQVSDIDALMQRTASAMEAVSKDAKSRGLRKGAGGTGVIKCPICKTGHLGYSVAGYNGHIHARCTTPKCVAWME